MHAALTGHVGLPLRVKETRFWGQYYHKGIEWYADHFRHCDPALPAGEACLYFATPNARERIARHLPDCKIIVTLRDPVDRTYSQYRLMRKMGLARGTFEEELNHPRIVDTNRYAFHLRGWMDLFGSDNVKVLLFDELRNHPQNFLDQVCDFVGVNHISLANTTIRDSDVNSYKYQPRTRRISRRISDMMDFMHEHRAYRTYNLLERIGFWEFWLTGRQPFAPLSPIAAQRLREQLLPEIEATEAITGFDLKAWKQPSESVNKWLDGLPNRGAAPVLSGRREIAAILLALIPLATGAVPDGLDLGTMRFNPAQTHSVLEDTDESDEGSAVRLDLAARSGPAVDKLLVARPL